MEACSASLEQITCVPEETLAASGAMLRGPWCQMRNGTCRLKIVVKSMPVRCGLTLFCSVERHTIMLEPVISEVPTVMTRYLLPSPAGVEPAVVISATFVDTHGQGYATGRSECSLEAEFVHGEPSDDLLASAIRQLPVLAGNPLMLELDMGSTPDVAIITTDDAATLASSGKLGPFSAKCNVQHSLVWADPLGVLFARHPTKPEWSMLQIEMNDAYEHGCLSR